MPWQNRSRMSLKLEFAKLADKVDANMSALCRRFNISRPTGYKWLAGYREEGPEGLKERSRRPGRSPNKTPEHIGEAVCQVRNRHREAFERFGKAEPTSFGNGLQGPLFGELAASGAIR